MIKSDRCLVCDMWILSFIAFGIILTIAAGVIKRFAPEFFSPIILSFSIVAVTFLLPILFSAFDELIGSINIETEHLKTLVKITALCLIAGSASDVCEDSGLKSVGNMISLAAEAASFILALPIVKEMITLIGSILL